jgi:hypothetical protein
MVRGWEVDRWGDTVAVGAYSWRVKQMVVTLITPPLLLLFCCC